MSDVPERAVELSPGAASMLRHHGVPDDARVIEREEVDWWGRTYAETESGLLVPEEAHPLEKQIVRETRDARGDRWTDDDFLSWLRGEKSHPEIQEEPRLGCDLFAGCGGFSLGMHMAGFDVVCALDNAPAAVHTYLLNLARPDVDLVFTDDGAREEWELRGAPDKPLEEWAGSAYRGRAGMERGCRGFVFGDARKVTGDDLLEAAGVDHFDVIFGGPPCQGLSTANANRCLEDPRNGLLWEFMRLVVELEPGAFMIENVPPLLTTADGALFEALAAIATDNGYYVRANICDASDFGVPQYRRRALVIGTHESTGKVYQFPVPTNWPVGRNPEGAESDDWTQSKMHAGGRRREKDVRLDVEVEYDEDTGRWSFSVDGDEAEDEAEPQPELFE